MASRAAKLPIAVAKGDGIGPEIMDACIAIMKAAGSPLEYRFVDMGKSVYLAGNSTGMTANAKDTVEKLGILYKGPMETPKGGGVKSINVTARKVWNAYANKRVFQTIPGVDTIFSKAGIPIDLTMFRENIEDTYGGIEHYETNDVVQCRRLITRPGSELVHKMAFEAALKKNAKRVTCVHKSNIMKLTDGLFLKTFYDVAKNYPTLKADDMIVDDCALKLVTNPTAFDVMVLTNLQGDIMSDLAAGLVGGLGMAPSANIGENVSIFEAVHGTAPDLVGKNLANPTALLMSGMMMLRHVGLYETAEGIRSALLQALEEGHRTRDLTPLATPSGPKAPLGTKEFAEAIIKRIPAELKQHSVAVNFEHKAPVKPTQQIMHVSKRNKDIESTVGVDVFVDSDNQPDHVAQKILAILPTEFQLTMISNRGTQVWPHGSLFTECVNHYRCRVELKDGPKKKSSEDELLDIVKKINKGVRVCSLQMLLKIGDQKGYSLAQGQ